MMMTILSNEARRRRSRGRLFLLILAAGAGLCGGAWAASGMPRDRSRTSVADDLTRTAARSLGDLLYGLADRPVADRAERAGASVALAGGPPRPGLRILVTDAWASPGSHQPMPAETPALQGS
jgi:hypothetical protein